MGKTDRQCIGMQGITPAPIIQKGMAISIKEMQIADKYPHTRDQTGPMIYAESIKYQIHLLFTLQRFITEINILYVRDH